MGRQDPVGRGEDPITVILEADVVADGAPGELLHRYALVGGPLAKEVLLVVGQPERHRHPGDGIRLIPQEKYRHSACPTAALALVPRRPGEFGGEQLGSGDLSEGGTISGKLIWEIGDTPGEYYVIYDPDIGGDRGVWKVTV